MSDSEFTQYSVTLQSSSRIMAYRIIAGFKMRLKSNFISLQDLIFEALGGQKHLPLAPLRAPVLFRRFCFLPTQPHNHRHQPLYETGSAEIRFRAILIILSVFIL